MTYFTQYEYYDNDGNSPANANWGSGQYVSLDDIVKNFMLVYTGNHSIIANEPRHKVIYHAKQAIKELNYDALREIKILQLDVDDQLRYIMPRDYVDYVRISLYENGMLYPLNESNKTMTSNAYLQASDGAILFDESGNILSPEMSQLDTDRIDGAMKTEYLNNNVPFDADYSYCGDNGRYFRYGIGQRYGLNTETANVNPLYQIDRKAGVIIFNSQMSGKSVVLEYIADGMENGDDSSVSVHKFFEKFIYSYIFYNIVSTKMGVQEYIVTRARKEMTALLRNARIRMSDFDPSKLLMPLRGQNKWLK